MTVFMTNLHETNIRNAYCEQIHTLSDVLRTEGQWDWNLQRKIDSDMIDLRTTKELDLVGDDLVRDWEAEVRKHVQIDTEIHDGTYIVTISKAVYLTKADVDFLLLVLKERKLDDVEDIFDFSVVTKLQEAFEQ